MAPIIPDPRDIRAFPDEAAFEAWMAANHDKAERIWLKLARKGRGVVTLSNEEAQDVGLCWGWINATRKSLDADHYLQLYTPRRPKSPWSQVNRDHVERLLAQGRMQAPGLAHVEAARADGRWDAAYGGIDKLPFPPELLAAIRADSRALSAYEALPARQRTALARAALSQPVAEIVADLARGRP